MCDRIGPEVRQRIALLFRNVFDRHALPATEMVFGQTRIQTQRQTTCTRQLLGERRATLQRRGHDDVPITAGHCITQLRPTLLAQCVVELPAITALSGVAMTQQIDRHVHAVDTPACSNVAMPL
jgi:hypothetical protein